MANISPVAKFCKSNSKSLYIAEVELTGDCFKNIIGAMTINSQLIGFANSRKTDKGVVVNYIKYFTMNSHPILKAMCCAWTMEFRMKEEIATFEDWFKFLYKVCNPDLAVLVMLILG